MQDVALFRVQDKVLFYSDMKETITAIKTLGCFENQLNIFSWLSLKEATFPKSLPFDPKETAWAKKLLDIYKLQLVTKREKKISAEAFYASIDKGVCSSTTSWNDLTRAEKDLLGIEQFLRDRFSFSLKNQAAAQDNFNRFLDGVNSKYPHLLFVK